MNLPKNKDEFIGQYWLKNDLTTICTEFGLPKNGSKEELTLNICNYFDKKQIVYFKKHTSKKSADCEISLINTIDQNYKNDEKHREFFKSIIGSTFKYNVQFMNWMNDNKGLKSYKEAVLQWKMIELEIKNGKKYEIGKQFEYNQYTRDFFKANPDKSRADCIKCWDYKKSKQGFHGYELSDLNILEKF